MEKRSIEGGSYQSISVFVLTNAEAYSIAAVCSLASAAKRMVHYWSWINLAALWVGTRQFRRTVIEWRLRRT